MLLPLSFRLGARKQVGVLLFGKPNSERMMLIEQVVIRWMNCRSLISVLCFVNTKRPLEIGF